MGWASSELGWSGESIGRTGGGRGCDGRLMMSSYWRGYGEVERSLCLGFRMGKGKDEEEEEESGGKYLIAEDMDGE